MAYSIYTPEDLLGIGTTNTDMKGDYIQMADIDMTGYEFNGIGSSSNSFNGTYDGNGFKISNLTITYNGGASEKVFYGLFNYCESASAQLILKNIKIEGLDFKRGNVSTDTWGYFGGVVGSINGDALIEDCTIDNVTMAESYITSSVYFGGIAGYSYNYNSTFSHRGNIHIRRCNVSGINIDNPNSGYTGGIIGDLYFRNNSESITRVLRIENCMAKGNITGKYASGVIGRYRVYSTDDGSDINYIDGLISQCGFEGDVTGTSYTGGFTSYALFDTSGYSNSNSTLHMRDCYCSGTISGVNGNGYLGGFVSYLVHKNRNYESGIASIVNCYSAMDMKNHNAMYVGAIGYYWTGEDSYDADGLPSTVIYDCFYDIDLVTKEDGTVIAKFYNVDTVLQEENIVGKTTTEMKKQATFVNWDFTNIWKIREGQTYPLFVLPALSLARQGDAVGASYKLGNSAAKIFINGVPISLSGSDVVDSGGVVVSSVTVNRNIRANNTPVIVNDDAAGNGDLVQASQSSVNIST